MDNVKQMITLTLVVCLSHYVTGIHDSFIGFTAWKEVPQTVSINSERIRFEAVLVNEGNAYQKQFSQFTCPLTGVYFISCNLMANNDRMYVRVLVGGQVVLHLYNRFSMDYNTASNSVIVNCSYGEVIYIESVDNVTNIFGQSGDPYSTFTVMLLSEVQGENFHSSLNGFSVSKEDIQNYESQDVITYSKINYNDGSYFVNIFRYNCSRNGVYFISFNNRLYDYGRFEIGIEQSSNVILHAKDTTGVNRFNTISNSRLIYCEAGDTLVVKATGSGSVSSHDGLYTTFNTFLLTSTGYGLYHDEVIAFSMYKKNNQIYEASQVITFDGILWDENNLYDRLLHRFLCPVSGFYYVSVTFVRNAEEPLYIRVEVQSQTVLLAEEESPENPWNTISNSGLVRCFLGERLQVTSTGNGSVYGDSTEILTTFTVFLMHEI